MANGGGSHKERPAETKPKPTGTANDKKDGKSS